MPKWTKKAVLVQQLLKPQLIVSSY